MGTEEVAGPILATGEGGDQVCLGKQPGLLAIGLCRKLRSLRPEWGPFPSNKVRDATSQASIFLVSKSDVHALCKVRSHGCACPAACLVLALRKLVEFAGGGSGSGSASGGFPSVGGVRPNDSFFKKAVALRPLCPTPARGFPTKVGTTSVFQRFGLELGVSKHIIGHMPRVSGAVQLAKAGLEIWKIQIFCRLGSDVVLRYIQDAPLEQSHKRARDAAVGLGLSEARNELVSQFRATNPDEVLSLPGGSLELASALALSDLHESMEVQLQRKDDRWSSVLSILEGKLEAVASRGGMETLRYVVNTSGKGKIHIVRNAFTTVCGWEWHDHRHAVRRQVLAEGDSVCTRCGAMSQGYSLVGRLRGRCPCGGVTCQVGCGTVTC